MKRLSRCPAMHCAALSREGMRKIREALRLRAEGFSGRRVAQSLSLGRASVSEYFRRADVAGLSWPLPDDLSDTDLEHWLYPHKPGASARDIPRPNWAFEHSELRRKGVTLVLLWEEYEPIGAGDILVIDEAGRQRQHGSTTQTFHFEIVERHSLANTVCESVSQVERFLEIACQFSFLLLCFSIFGSE